MTAKQLLHDYVDALSEEDAAATAAWLVPSRTRQLTQAEREIIERGLREAEAGLLTPLDAIDWESDEL